MELRRLSEVGMASRVNIKITGKDLKGIKKLKENLAKLQSIEGKVGVFGGSYPTGESVPEIANTQEFGTTKIPARSFLRMPLHSKRYKIVGDKEFLQRYVIDALQSGFVHMPLDYITKRAESIIQEAFDTRGWGKWAANAPLTIKLKGSDSPLIDTSRLRQSVSSIVGKRGEV
jgi:hypothetical protein